MPKGIYAAASAMYTDARSMNAIAQNLANAQTAGYRRAEPLRDSFADLLQNRGRFEDISGDGGAGVTEAGIWRSFSNGERAATQRELDFGIAGDGFFTVEDQKTGDMLLTRGGHFDMNIDRVLVDPDGRPVQGQDGRIIIPNNAHGVQVDESGRIFAKVITAEGTMQNNFIDQFRVVTVDDPGNLQPINGQYFRETEGMTRDSDSFQIQQGYLERGNLDPVSEMVEMITIQRRYDAAQRALKTEEGAGKRFSELLHGG